MKTIIDEGLCTGCGLCADSCPDAFEMQDDKAVTKGDSVSNEATDCVKDAAANCPVEAIKVD
ncbi:MAG: ferredoxin [Candidatus Omnitrophota bacterium]